MLLVMQVVVGISSSTDSALHVNRFLLAMETSYKTNISAAVRARLDFLVILQH